jgi:hypothetical protein
MNWRQHSRPIAQLTRRRSGSEQSGESENSQHSRRRPTARVLRGGHPQTGGANQSISPSGQKRSSGSSGRRRTSRRSRMPHNSPHARQRRWTPAGPVERARDAAAPHTGHCGLCDKKASGWWRAMCLGSTSTSAPWRAQRLARDLANLSPPTATFGYSTMPVEFDRGAQISSEVASS